MTEQKAPSFNALDWNTPRQPASTQGKSVCFLQRPEKKTLPGESAFTGDKNVDKRTSLFGANIQPFGEASPTCTTAEARFYLETIHQ